MFIFQTISEVIKLPLYFEIKIRSILKHVRWNYSEKYYKQYRLWYIQSVVD